MSKNQMQDRITEELKKVKETGAITSEKIYEIVRQAVSDAVAEGKGGAEEIRPIVKDALSASVEGLKAVEADVTDNLKASLEGALDGVRSRKNQTIDAVGKELCDLEKKLVAEKAELAQSVRDAFLGAKEASETFSDEVRTRIESVSTDIKLDSAELLGLTRETVKEAVKQAIKAGNDVKETVTHITGEATEKALKEGHFRADRVKEIVEKVISGAVEAAEEMGQEVKIVAQGAFAGTQKGIAAVVESVSDTSKEFLHDDLARTKEDLETIEELFTETVLRVARNSADTAKNILTELVEHTGKTTSVLREKTGQAAGEIAEKLKETGKDVTHTTVEAAGKVTSVIAEEALELGKRSVDIATGAISGMLQGAKDAFDKGKENK